MTGSRVRLQYRKQPAPDGVAAQLSDHGVRLPARHVGQLELDQLVAVYHFWQYFLKKSTSHKHLALPQRILHPAEQAAVDAGVREYGRLFFRYLVNSSQISEFFTAFNEHIS